MHLLKYLRPILLCLALLPVCGSAQSSDPAFPSPVTSNELSGVIKARDMGDPRLTTHYYTFDGGQGDIFINVVAKNFSGDIDVFTETGLRPLTKMVFYADAGLTETGRLIYLRRPERLILRIQGRTPGDDPASYQIKFAGSFVALAPAKDEKPPTVEDPANDTGITVNSVGTIVAVKPKPKPTPKATPVEEPPTRDDNVAKNDSPADETKDDELPVKKPAERERTAKPVVVIEDFPGPSETERRKPPVEKTTKRAKSTQRKPAAKPKPRPEPPVAEEPKPDPLANVRLVVTLKDGSIVEKMLNELVRFSFDKGVLTVIGKDGNITRYPMTDVEKVTVQ